MKKLSLQLTISLVSLFISVLLILIGNNNVYCLSFGFIFLALAIVLFVVDRFIFTRDKIKQYEDFITEGKLNDTFLFELDLEIKKLKKQRISILLGAMVFVILLLALAFKMIIV